MSRGFLDRYIIALWEINDDDKVDSEFIGSKAEGLLSIPREWTLPFIILTRKFYFLWCDKKSARETLDKVSDHERKLLENFKHHFKNDNSNVLIRSNSPNENIDFRGEYNSKLVKNNIDDIINGIDKVLEESLPDPMFILIQEFLAPAVLGHISNERRVTPKKNKWLLERHDLSIQKFIIASKSRRKEVVIAKKDKDLYCALRSFAYFLSNLNSKSDVRYHCEWIWNAERVWLIQVDKSIRNKNLTLANNFLNRKVEPIPVLKNLSVIKNFTHPNSNSNNWKKLRSPIEFKKVNIPCSDVYVLAGNIWSNPNKDTKQKIFEDLKLLCSEHPIIVRCDIAKNVRKDDLLLPTSGALSCADDVIEHMELVHKKFLKLKILDKNWAFLISFKYEVKASALIQAYPFAQRIKVDALWGYPDGLLYYPHDTYYYYPSEKKHKYYKRYKGVGLFPTSKGWKPYGIAAPYDWQIVLKKSEVATMANWALELANSMGKEVQLMAFAKLEDKPDSNGCLPWHFTNLKISEYKESLRFLPKGENIKIIKNMDDLKSIENSDGLNGILIKPVTSLLRDYDFLIKISSLALKYNIPIYYEGSILSHAYYILSKNGTKVIPIASHEPIDSIRYNKLVRDNIPIIIKKAGGVSHIRKIPKEKAITLLAQKLIEESIEVWNSNDNTELINELADVLEVIDALISYCGVDKKELAKIKKKKLIKRGGFKELFFLEETSVRSFKSIQSDNGEIPLLLDDNNLTSKKIEKKQNLINFKGDLNFEKGIEFDIPFTPYLDDGLNKKELIETKGGVVFSVNNIEDRIYIKLNIKNKANTQRENNNQLRLFEEF
ncbi:hypothetical protein AB9K26_12830 [Psychroserpens sp. XS_ASV72]|uniref:hypothetical protein n=1 Tax=Psychroserpens sp. XS_ASV72 TaxID=3241293 RepID=UPI00351428A3